MFVDFKALADHCVMNKLPAKYWEDTCAVDMDNQETLFAYLLG